ncbi:MAG: AAA family ATPase [Candidatus Obscuribacterales bacterium]|nr:AAA family ATPase [Candidatus Obscuribacterales bacterium]
MKKLITFLMNLWSSLLFRKTVINFAAFFAALGLFYILITSHVVTRTPERVVPREYAFLAAQNKTMAAVDLEQALRSQSKEVEGLVFFDGLKSIVVMGNGFEKDRLVIHADTEEMLKLARANKLLIVEKPSAAEEGTLLPGWFMFAVIGFIIWFGVLMFKRRENGEEDSRFSVLCAQVPMAIEGIVAHYKIKKTKFYMIVVVSLLLLNAALFFSRVFHNDHLKTLPPEISSVQKIPGWQAARHLEKHPDEFLRVTVVEELNTAYLVINTLKAPDPTPVGGGSTPVTTTTVGASAPAKSAAPEAPKVVPVERTTIFKQDADGKKEFNDFMALLKGKKIETKSVPAITDKNYLTSISVTGQWVTLGLLLITVIIGGVMMHNWQEWSDAEAPKGQNRAVGAGGGRVHYAASDVEVRDEDRKTFQDVAGCQEAIDELRVVEKKIRRPRLYKVFGAPVPSGVILYGPPGTGKTLLARALSGEIGGYFEALSGSQFVEMYVGVGAKRVREAYTRARTAARRSGRISIVFIDEIDAIAKRRGQGESGGDKEYEQTLNELLVQMNGFGNHGLVLTMAATNRLDILDEAILRPGRFDIKVKVPKPDKKGRAQIYSIYLKKLKVVLEGDTPEKLQEAHAKLLEDLARRSHDFSGAEIEGAIKNGATIAVERQFGNVTEDLTEDEVEEYKDKAIITMKDLHEGVDKMAYGTQIKSRVRTDKERWATAVHEIGHAAVPTVRGGDPVNRITIVMTDKSLGLMDSSPEEGERYDWTDVQFGVRLETMLAGRAAEKILLGKISTGASNDFERASQLARSMVGMYGMSKAFGVKSLPLDQHGFPTSKVGEILLDKFNNAWGEIIDTTEKATDELITTHRAQVEACAKVLYDEETLTGDEFRKLWNANAPKSEASDSDAPKTTTATDAAADSDVQTEDGSASRGSEEGGK